MTEVTVSVTEQVSGLALLVQLTAVLIGALTGAGLGAYLGYRFASRIETQRQAIANLQHHSTVLSAALRAFATLGAELAANARSLEMVLIDTAGGNLRQLGARTAVWDGRAADIAHFVHELTPDEYELMSGVYEALQDVEAALERALGLQGRGVAGGALQQLIDEARASAEQATLAAVPATAVLTGVRQRLGARIVQMAQAADQLYAGTDFDFGAANAPNDDGPPSEA